MTYIKRSGGGVALRATFAALIALGSIPGAAAVSPNFSQVAFAEASDSSNQSSDTYIDNLTTAADWKTIGFSESRYYEWISDPYNPYISAAHRGGHYSLYRRNCGDNDYFRTTDFSEYRNDFLSSLKEKLRGNTNKKEIPITCAYKDIESALTDPDKFYALYKNVTDKPGDYGFSDATKFKEFITSKPNNDTDVSLPDTTALLLNNADVSTSLGKYNTIGFYPCTIDSQYSEPSACHVYTDDDYYYSDGYDSYKDYWSHVLSGLDENWSFSYKNTATGCKLPRRLKNESERLYDVEEKPKYLVQTSLEVEYTDDWERYGKNTFSSQEKGIERFSYELPLHTIAKFVKDIDVDVPTDKVVISQSGPLTKDDEDAILGIYKQPFVNAMKKACDNSVGEVAIRAAVGQGHVTRKNEKLFISVPGMKTQVVNASEITETLDEFKTQAEKEIDAAAKLKKEDLKQHQGTSTDKEVKDAQDKVDQLANAAKDDINKNAADAKDVKSKKDTAIQNINKVTAENKALADAKTQAGKEIDAAATKKKEDLKKNQGTSTDKEVKDAQDKVDQLANAAKEDINKNAADAKDVKSKKDTAIQNINKVTAENAALQNSKKGAKDKLKDYGLSEDEQKPFIKEIDDAKDDKGVDDALLKAAKAALKKKIGEAEQKQKEIAYTSASTEKKTEFDEKLQAAKDVRDKADAKTDEITAATKALNTAMDNLDGRAPDTEELYALHTMYRLYNPYSHEHLFTTDENEKDNLVTLGWRFEGTVGKVYMHGEKGGVYRLYNPTTGEHHYTTDENELAKCVKAGWKNEGVKFFSVLDTDKQTVGVVSMYNPYEKKFYHHYTSDAGEIAKMVKAGWRKEEIKWYAAK